MQGGPASSDPAKAGGQGGLLDVLGVLTDSGAIMIGAGHGGDSKIANGLGGRLEVSGTLSITTTGSVSLAGGNADLGQTPNGGVLTNTGVLRNAGVLTLYGGHTSAAHYLPAGYGGVLDNAGQLANTGTLLILGGRGGYLADGGQGANLADNGVLTNTGKIEIGGGAGGGYEASGGAGGTLNATGVLTNNASIMLDGGMDSTARYSGGGHGGALANAGTMTNAVVIEIGAGRTQFADYSGGYGAQFSDSGMLTNSGTILVDATQASETAIGTGGTLSVSGVLFAEAKAVLAIAGGAGDASRYAYYGGAGGVLEFHAGPIDSTNYTTIDLQAGAAGANGGAAGTGASLIVDDGAILFSNILAIDAGTPGKSGSGSASLTLGDGATLQNSGTITNRGSLLLGAGANIYSGTLRNLGTLSGDGGVTTVSIVNTGLIDAGSGTLTLANDQVTSGGASGVLAVGAGGLLAISAGSIDGAQSVSLASTSATLGITAIDAGLLVRSPAGGTIDLGGGGVATLNAADTNLSVFLSAATNLTLSRITAIAATGSSGNDTITALSSGQTLTGALGADLLTGAAATADLFRDTAAGLNGDTIADFAGTDAIDITDIASGAGLALSYTQQGDHGLLSVSNSPATTSVTLQGRFTATSFTTASDNHGGVQITLHG